MHPMDTTVFVIEDDDGMRAALEQVLRIAGFRVEAFASAEHCLASDLVASADCIVCDIELPGDSGFVLLDRLIAGGSSVPAIVITAYDSPAARGEAQRLHAAAYLVKPFEGGTLVHAVRDATGLTTTA